MSSPEPQENQQAATTATILAALVAALVAGSAVAAIIYLLGRLAGISVDAVRAMFRYSPELAEAIVVERPRTGAWSEPQFAAYNQNLQRRASYLINAARRVSRADDRSAAFAAELRYWRQHREAARGRMRAADQVAKAMRRHGTARLGWVAKLDARTSGECRAAHGRNFDPRRVPPIGYPGAVHTHCRCRPGPPFATRRRVEDIRPDHRRAG